MPDVLEKRRRLVGFQIASSAAIALLLWSACTEVTTPDTTPDAPAAPPPCPAGFPERGRCDGEVERECQQGLLYSTDCAAQGQRCAYSDQGYSACTSPCPKDVDFLGRCEGTRLKSCRGDVFYDVDCADHGAGWFCGKDSSGAAYCSEPCPPGLDALGRCEGTRSLSCPGVLVDLDCSSKQASCGSVSRYGSDCYADHCPPGVTATGACSADGSKVTSCSWHNLQVDSACTNGSACGWDEASCSYGCLGGVPPRTCDDEGLAEGASRCTKDLYFNIFKTQRCEGGVLLETECPASLDPGNTCKTDASGQASCVVPICQGTTRKRCTDRNVLVDCSSYNGGNYWWLDCGQDACIESGDDAYCSCKSPTYEENACLRSASDGSRFRYICQQGRVVAEPCECKRP